VSKSKQISYSQALTELESIVGEIELEEIDVDALAEKVKRAAYLIKSCKGRLRSTEEDVKKALTEVEDGADGEGSADEESEGN
jgi:exodeoxyribonuclease VII small subunit